MSFFSDPKLYLVWGRQMGYKFYIFRIQTKPGFPFLQGEFYNHELLNFSKHLSLPHNKEADFESLFAYLSKNDKFVNCQGIVINWFSNDRTGRNSWSWSPELLNLSSYGIHALAGHQENEADARKNDRDRDEKLQALEKRVTGLLEQLNQEKQAHEKQLFDLTAKLEEYSGGAKGGSEDDEHWMTGHAVPSYLVPFEELDVLSTFPRNTPLTITKATQATPVIGEDNSTNVKVSRFYGGVFPIVIVNVEELVPDKENARFDPDIWGLFQNAGTSYAARKPFKSEMV